MGGWSGARRGFEESYVAPAVWFGDQTNNVIIATIVAGRLFLFYPPSARKREQLPELSAWTEGCLFGPPHVEPSSPGLASTQALQDSLPRTLLQQLELRLGFLKRWRAAVVVISSRGSNMASRFGTRPFVVISRRGSTWKAVMDQNHR
jgi:hypothetical protein